MLKRIRISVTAPLLLPSNLTHFATNYKLSKSIVFTGSDVIADVTSDINLYDNNFTVDIQEDDNIYIVTQYIYKEIDGSGNLLKDSNGNDIIKLGTPSRISSIKGNQEGVKISDTIVNTPTIVLGTSYNYNIDGNIMLKTSDFKMFSSSGIHKATSWVIKDLAGKVLFKREYDLDNLTTILLPDEFKLEDNFIVYVAHHSDTNADSNYGFKENIISNEKPKFKIKPVNQFIVGKYLYFNVEMLNKRFKNIDVKITDINGNITSIDGIKTTLIKVNTSGFIERANYKFDFIITSETDSISNIEVILFSHSYKELYDQNKVYLDKYNYLGLLLTNGLTNCFSYELSNGNIFLQKNLTNYITNTEVVSNGVIYLDKAIDIDVKNIDNPNIYVNELLNGDIVICHKDSNDNVNIGLYGINPSNNEMYLIKNKVLVSKEPLSYAGGITISGNKIFYVDYDIGALVELEPYIGTVINHNLPYTVLHGMSLTTNLDGNIIIAGGTNANVNDFSILHTRLINKVFLYDIKTTAYTEIGHNLLDALPMEIYQFHMVFRHDNKITIFNNVNDTNYTIIGDQATYVLDFVHNTLTSMMNDHLDSIPYGSTIVLRNGDIIRYSSIVKDPQKMYLYISDSMKVDTISDNNTLVYDATKMIINSGETIHIDKPCMYDNIVIKPGGKITMGDDNVTTYDSTCLIVTRDTVLTQTEFKAGNYSMVYKACSDAKFILVG